MSLVTLQNIWGFPSLNAATAPATGSACPVPPFLATAIGVQPVGIFSAATIIIEGSLDGITFTTLATITNPTSGAITFIANMPVAAIRARMTAFTGTSISVYITSVNEASVYSTL